MVSTPISRLALRRPIARRAAFISLIVGHVLAAISHGEKILGGTLTPADIAKIALTFFVPYVISTITSVLALREQERLMAMLREID